MKKLSYLLLALLAVFILPACSDDDDDKNKDHEIVGTWAVSSIKPDVVIKNDNETIAALITQEIEKVVTAGAADIKGLKIELTNKNEVKMYEQIIGTYTINGKRITFSDKVMESIHPLMPSVLNFDISNNILTFSTDNMKDLIVAGLSQSDNPLLQMVDLEKIGIEDVKILLTLDK